jgi:allantoate deiminase
MSEISIDEAGRITMDRFEQLGAISDEDAWLTRAYGTPALRKAQEAVAGWMRAAGMLVSRDAVGNLTGRYDANGSAPEPKTNVFGGHLDTVRNAGKYDGTLGVLAGLAVVEQMHASGTRAPFAIEVIAFADEESYRFPTMYLGSSVWTGNFDVALLDTTDQDGVTLETAIREFGCDPEALRGPLEARGDILAFVELHIEQGPVLEAIDSPVGIVSAIAGASRFTVDVPGVAGHAGTVPMHLRSDALVTAAGCVLAINGIGRETEDLVATVGSLTVTPNAKNVIPGHVEFTIDIRHQYDHVREEAVGRILDAITSIGRQHGVEIVVTPMPGGASTPMDPGLIATWNGILEAEEIQPQLLPSGAGHDAVTVSAIAPVSMLFLRCDRGISHNPAESITEADTATGIRVLARLVQTLSAGWG